MPFEPTIRTIALALLILVGLWLVLASLGIRLRSLRLRRSIRSSGQASLVCGACGHPAVSLGQIDACPECGSNYSVVGLDGPRTGIMWAPPLFVLGAFLLSIWALASVSLVPKAARWANMRTIGVSEVEQVVSTRGYAPTNQAQQSGHVPDFAFELDVTTFRPSNWLQQRAADRVILSEGVRRVRFTTGGSVGMLTQNWSNMMPMITEHFPSDPTDPSLIAMVQPSTNGTLPAGMTMLEIEWRGQEDGWTLSQRGVGRVDSGKGLDTGFAALFAHAKASPALATGPPLSTAHKAIIQDFATRSESPTGSPPSSDALPDFSGLRVFGDNSIVLSRTAYHPAAPWGLAAAIATSASLLLIALVLMVLSWRIRRRLSPGVQTAVAREP